MAGIQVIAGNFPKGWAPYLFGTITFSKSKKQGFPKNIELDPKQELLTVEVISREEECRIGKAAGTGIIGGLLFGGVGVVAGGLLGAAGKTKTTITFTATFTRNRHLLATTDLRTFLKLQSIAFDNDSKSFVTQMMQTGDDIHPQLTDIPAQHENCSPLAEIAKMTSQEKRECLFGLTIFIVLIWAAIWAVRYFFFS